MSDGTSDCMFVLLSLLLGMQFLSLWRHIVFRSSAISLISFCYISCNYLVNGTFFRTKKELQLKYNVSFDFLSIFFPKRLPTQEVFSEVLEICFCLRVKFLSYFYSDLSQWISLKISNIKFREIPSSLGRYEQRYDEGNGRFLRLCERF